MSKPSNFQDVPNPHSSVAGQSLTETSGPNSPVKMAAKFLPKGAKSDTPLATLARIGIRLLDRVTGKGYSADELGALLVPAATVMASAPVNAARATGTLTVSTGALTAGNTVTINGVVFTAVAEDATPTGNQFKIGTDYTTAAANLLAAIQARTGYGGTVFPVTASSAAGASNVVITVASIYYTTAGNSVGFIKTAANIAISVGGTLTGGTEGTPATCLGNRVFVGSSPGSYAAYECERVSPVIWAVSEVNNATVIAALGFTPGTAATKDTGTGAGQVPVTGDYMPAEAAPVAAHAAITTGTHSVELDAATGYYQSLAISGGAVVTLTGKISPEPTDGQKLYLRIDSGVGGCTVKISATTISKPSLSTTDWTGVGLTLAASESWESLLRYNTTINKWCFLSFTGGFA